MHASRALLETLFDTVGTYAPVNYRQLLRTHDSYRAQQWTRTTHQIDPGLRSSVCTAKVLFARGNLFWSSNTLINILELRESHFNRLEKLDSQSLKSIANKFLTSCFHSFLHLRRY